MKSSDTKSSLVILVDSQADISIIKISALKDSIKLDKEDIISMKGITNEKTVSLGSCKINININTLSIEHKFHVVADDFHMPAHGIMGKDFLRRHKCLLDYSEMTFTVRPNNVSKVTVELQSEVIRGISALPARSESFRLFRLNSKEYPCVVPAQQIDKEVFIPTTIASQRETYLRVLNVSYDMKLIDTSNPKLTTECIDDYNIIAKRKQYSKCKNEVRMAQLQNILRKNTPEHAHENFLPICNEFADIFHVSGDKPSVNNFYEQQLHVTDSTPVYTRNYRLPHSQKMEINRQVSELLENDLIEPSVSNFNSPLILVPKKSTDGKPKYRMCVDYRKLNRKLVPDRFPLPRMEDIFDNLGKAKFFSSKPRYHYTFDCILTVE